VRILFDQGTPVPLRRRLNGHVVATACELGWSTVTNGDLIRLAEEEGYELLITTDTNLCYPTLADQTSTIPHQAAATSCGLTPFILMRHSIGRVVATAAVAASVPEAVIVGLLDRHVARDWGDLNAEDKASNDADHSHAEGRLFSSYDTEEHGTIWVITEDLRGEAGGPITTVLFPEDY